MLVPTALSQEEKTWGSRGRCLMFLDVLSVGLGPGVLVAKCGSGRVAGSGGGIAHIWRLHKISHCRAVILSSKAWRQHNRRASMAETASARALNSCQSAWGVGVVVWTHEELQLPIWKWIAIFFCSGFSLGVAGAGCCQHLGFLSCNTSYPFSKQLWLSRPWGCYPLLFMNDVVLFDCTSIHCTRI